jgi:hypothetical protein
LFKRTTALKQKAGGSAFLIKGQFVLPSSLQNSKNGKVKLLKDVSSMRSPGYDSDSGVSKKSNNFIRDTARTIVHQKYRIFIGKFLEGLQFV